MKIAFISGHLDLTFQEFQLHYKSYLDKASFHGDLFVVGDANGCDQMVQAHLHLKGANVTVYHMLESPRNCLDEFSVVGGFNTDEERDAAMTAVTDYDIAWVRPGREKSGTANNIKRREGKRKATSS
jgi:hypothetical protein